ncbi:MAG: fasciclin domain-containing protein [Bacteroidota bacterium]
MTKTPFYALLFACTLALAACGDSSEPTADDMAADDTEMAADDMSGDDMTGPTIVDLAGEAGLNTLAAAVGQAELVETLNSAGPFTVFAPTDEAFGALPEGTLDTVMMDENREMLQGILTYHVLPMEAMSEGISGTLELETVNGAMITVTKAEDGTVTVTDAGGNTATVVTADVDASNGVVHVIDAVLMPPSGE